MNKFEEHKILEGIAAGDEAIIKTFYKKNLPYIRQYVLHNSGNEEDVEDVFQDALVFVYQKLKTGSLELHASLRTYFYAVCKNMWRNRLRRNKKFVVTKEVANIPEQLNITVIEELTYRERQQVYRKYFLKLNDSCRQVLTLVFEGKSMKEIAKVTGYSEGYTRKKKFECKRSLIEMIEKDSVYRELIAGPGPEKE